MRRLLITFSLVTLGLSLAAAGTWYQLRKGITIDAVTLPSLRISRLTIRLEQRLAVTIGELTISDGRVHFDPDTWVPRIRTASRLLQELHIRRLLYHGYSGSLDWADRSFHLRNDLLDVTASLSFQEGVFAFDLERLKVRDYDLQVAGSGTYGFRSRRLAFSGTVQAYTIHGKADLELQGAAGLFHLQTDDFATLADALAPFPLDQDLRSWLTKKITARAMRIEELRFRFRLDRGVPVLDPQSISGRARLRDVAIIFNPDLAPVRVQEASLRWHDDRLDCSLNRPMFRNRSLEGSQVTITNLLGEAPSIVTIRLRTRTRLDRPVLDLLRAYDIDLPLVQTEGFTAADLRLDLRLRDMDLQARGDFSTGSSGWLWQGIPLRCQGAEVALVNRRVSIRKAEISWQDRLRAGLSGDIDMAAGEAHLSADVHSLLLDKDGTTIVRAEDLVQPVVVDFRDTIRISLPLLEVEIVRDGGGGTILLHSLAAVRPLVPILAEIPLDGGTLRLTSPDMERFQFQGTLKLLDSALRDHGRPVTDFRFQGSSQTGSTIVSVNRGKITARITDKLRIHLKDYGIAIDENRSADSLHLPLPTHISAVNSTLQVLGLTIPATSYKADIDGSMIRISAILPSSGTIRAERRGRQFHLVGTGLTADLVRQVVSFVDLEGGKYSVSLWGTMEDFEGYLECSNVLVRDKDFVLLNNIMAFLDTIPALATFSSAGFNSNGYQVEKGVAHFRYRQGILTIIDSFSEGTSINTRAKGTLDFNRKTIHMEVTLQTLKSLSKVINTIPWVGYAILGKDGTMSTVLQISGSLEHPEVTTHLSEQAMLAPLNILERTLTWPLRLFGWDTDEKNKPAPPSPPPAAIPNGESSADTP